MSVNTIDEIQEQDVKSPVRRVIDVARIQTVNINTLVMWPVGILALVLAVNYALFALIGDVAPPDGRSTGALTSIYVVVAITHAQTITQLFPFALGISITRRVFYTGAALVVTVQALAAGLLVTVLELVERATGGWGLNLKFFGLEFLTQDNFFVQWLAYTVPFIALSAICIFCATVFKRWGQSGLLVMGVVTMLLGAAAGLLITLQHAWPAIGRFFVDTPTLALTAGYPLIIAVVAMVGGYLLIRRATP